MANRIPLSSDSFRQFDRLAFVTRRPARAGTGGEHISRRPAPSTDFIDYRPYQPGDDFRRVDWNVYGRLGSLQVKVTEGRERLDVLLVLDCSSSMAYGSPSKLDVAGQLAAALAYIGAAHADAVRIALLGGSTSNAWWTRPFARRSRIAELIGELSQIAPVGRVDLDAALAETGPTVPRNSLAVVISDLLSPEGAVTGLDALRARIGDVSVLHVVSPDELEPDFSGEVELIDAESGDKLELGVSQETLATYRARLRGWLDARAADCQRRGIRYVRVQTDRSLPTLVMDDLRRGGLLR